MSARRSITALAAAVLVLTAATTAQWLRQPTRGIPRAPDGKPNLSAPATRDADGTPDMSGLWLCPENEKDVPHLVGK
jgi:hypothetical protein